MKEKEKNTYRTDILIVPHYIRFVAIEEIHSKMFYFCWHNSPENFSKST